MKVILINGSPHENGSTRAALDDIIEELQDNRIETKLYWVGMEAVHGCIACGKCNETHRGIFNEDIVNEVLDDMPFVEGNLPTGHKSTIRTGLPQAAWRKLNYGVKPGKSTAGT